MVFNLIPACLSGVFNNLAISTFQIYLPMELAWLYRCPMKGPRFADIYFPASMGGLIQRCTALHENYLRHNFQQRSIRDISVVHEFLKCLENIGNFNIDQINPLRK